MRRLARVGTLLAAMCFAASACASVEPFCSEFDDDTGRAIILCPGSGRIAVCDEPGTTARFEREESGSILRGGDEGRCNAEREPSCPAGTVGEPYCILLP